MLFHSTKRERNRQCTSRQLTSNYQTATIPRKLWNTGPAYQFGHTVVLSHRGCWFQGGGHAYRLLRSGLLGAVPGWGGRSRSRGLAAAVGPRAPTAVERFSEDIFDCRGPGAGDGVCAVGSRGLKVGTDGINGGISIIGTERCNHNTALVT